MATIQLNESTYKVNIEFDTQGTVTVLQAKGDKGDQGNPGPANTLSIGTVTKGDNAAATITGTSPNQTLNLTLPKGDKGDDGDKGDTGDPGSQIWTTGTAPASPNYTFTKSNLEGNTGVDVKIGDVILYSYYRYTVSSVSTSTVQCTTRASIRGAAGAASKWYTGTGITGTSTTETIYSGSGVSSAVVGDMYLNTDTANVYRCTVAGNASTAKWVYATNIKGPKGDPGSGGGGLTCYDFVTQFGVTPTDDGQWTSITQAQFNAIVDFVTALNWDTSRITLSAGSMSSGNSYYRFNFDTFVYDNGATDQNTQKLFLCSLNGQLVVMADNYPGDEFFGIRLDAYQYNS